MFQGHFKSGIALAGAFLLSSALIQAQTIAYDAVVQAGNQGFTGNLGLDFNVNPGLSIIVTQLGAFDNNGNGFTGTVTVGIFNRTTGLLVGPTATFTGTAGTLVNGDRFLPVTPFVLGSGSYSIVAVGFNATDLNGNTTIVAPAITPSTENTGGALISFVGAGRFDANTTLDFPPPGIGFPSNVFLAGTFQFTGVMAPTLVKTFAAPAFGMGLVNQGSTTTATLTLTNPNPVPLTNPNFSDTLPLGITIASGPISNTCGGTVVTSVAGSTPALIQLSGGTIPASGSCTVTVPVAFVGVGVQTNGGFPVVTNEAPTPFSTAVTITIVPTGAYQLNYLPAQVGGGITGGYIDLSNDGSLGADPFGPLSGSTGRICANVYVFTADEQESECCSCLITPNALVHLSAADLIGNPGNGVTPTLGVVVKLLATVPGTSASVPGTNAGPFTASSCNAASPFTAANLAPGLVALGTKFHTNSTTSPATTSLTETRFSAQQLSIGELSKLTNLCQFLSGNQSGAGLCKACSLGGLGASKQ